MKFSSPTLYEFPTFRLSEIAHEDRCRKCYSLIWSLIVGGFTTRLDPEPLDTYFKLVAHLSKRYTYELYKGSNGEFSAEFRGSLRIIKDDDSRITLGAHICTRTGGRTSLPVYFPQPANAVYLEGELPF